MARGSTVESEEEVLKSKAKPEEEDGSEGGENEEVEEYEIEEVMDAKRGYFPEGRMGYFVKWKGYGEADNSWVDEQDAENAKDLVDEFWRKNPHKKRIGQRKSVDKKSPKKPQKSIEIEDITSDAEAGSVATKKRGRKSVTKAESEDAMEVDQPEARAPKKAKKSQLAKARTETPEPEERVLKTMDSYMGQKSWENLVKAIDTVEREPDGDLYIYFTLTTGDSVREKSIVCKERFPRKLLDFYEDNLRWRTAEELQA